MCIFGAKIGSIKFVIMKRELLNNIARRIATTLIATTMVSGYATAKHRAATYADDDMYASHNQSAIEQREIASEQARQMAEQQRMDAWTQILGIEADRLARYDESFDTPYGEKLRALSADSYELPASYYQYEYQEVLETLAEYDPTLYNATIDYNGELSIEPKYISSIYGAWENPYYDSYSWIYGYPAYGYPAYGYYSMWGYPYSSYGFGMGYGFSYSYYNPWWGGYPGYGYGYPYYGFGYAGWYSPYYFPSYYYPNHRPGGSTSGSRRAIVKSAMPSQQATGVAGKRQQNGSTVGTSSGSSYNRSATQYRSPSNNSSTPSRTPSTTPSRPSSTPSVQRNSIGR